MQQMVQLFPLLASLGLFGVTWYCNRRGTAGASTTATTTSSQGNATEPASCGVLVADLGNNAISGAIGISYLRPFRLPTDALKASGDDAASAASNDLTTVVAVVQLMRTLLGLLIQWRERQQLREEDSYSPTHPRTATGDEMLETPLMLIEFSATTTPTTRRSLNGVFPPPLEVVVMCC